MSRLASQAVIHTTKGDLKVQLFYKVQYCLFKLLNLIYFFKIIS